MVADKQRLSMAPGMY